MARIFGLVLVCVLLGCDMPEEGAMVKVQFGQESNEGKVGRVLVREWSSHKVIIGQVDKFKLHGEEVMGERFKTWMVKELERVEPIDVSMEVGDYVQIACNEKPILPKLCDKPGVVTDTRDDRYGFEVDHGEFVVWPDRWFEAPTRMASKSKTGGRAWFKRENLLLKGSASPGFFEGFKDWFNRSDPVALLLLFVCVFILICILISLCQPISGLVTRLAKYVQNIKRVRDYRRRNPKLASPFNYRKFLRWLVYRDPYSK